jgi:hypothetical protein
MPSVIKRKTSHIESSGFDIYTGEEPPRGGYRAVIKKCAIQKSKGDNLMYAIVVELKAKPGTPKSQYDGWPSFPYIVMTDTEGNLAREQAFYMAICGKADAEVSTVADASKFKPGDKQQTPVTKIGGQNPVGKIVNVQVKDETQEDGSTRKVVDRIFRVRDEDAEDTAADEPDIEDEDDEDAEGLPLYEEDDLRTKGLPALRKILQDEFGMDVTEAKSLKTKDALVSAILEAQDEEADEDEDEDEEDPEDDPEEEEEEEDEEDEDDEEDPEEAVRAELADMDRTALKALLKKRKVEFRVTTKTTDDEIREALVPVLLEDPPF